MWSVVPLDPYLNRRRKWPKKHGKELLAVHNNLDTFFNALIGGQRPADAKFGFLHPEPGGVLAIDQKGGGPHLKETRLYIFPETRSEELFLITLGDKSSQSADLEQCQQFTKEHNFQDFPRPLPRITRERSHAQEQ